MSLAESEDKKPLIAILMAVYEPKMDWLREQLISLNNQTYPHLQLFLRDDCSKQVAYEDIQELAKQCITTFPYSINRNEENLGSNKTFERLTEEAGGAYFAYCDQDDIWLPEKLSLLKEHIEKTNAGIACSDVYVMDEKGEKVADSIRELRPRHCFQEGNRLSDVLIYRNFVIGCTMLIRSEIAQRALPFSNSMIHDHYLAFVCSTENGISVYPQPLVMYRQHSTNQTGVLMNIRSKDEYITGHFYPFYNRVNEMRIRYPNSISPQSIDWAEARLENIRRRPGAARRLFHLRFVNASTTMFELIALRMPDNIFRLLVSVIKRGRI